MIYIVIILDNFSSNGRRPFLSFQSCKALCPESLVPIFFSMSENSDLTYPNLATIGSLKPAFHQANPQLYSHVHQVHPLYPCPQHSDARAVRYSSGAG